jgi:transposase
MFTPKNVTTLYQTPYSPDLSPPEYVLYPILKMDLKELHFADIAEIQEFVNDELKQIQIEEFSAASQKMYKSARSYIMQMWLILN